MHLIDPGRGITTFEKVFFFFVPAHDESGILAAPLFKAPTARHEKKGTLVIRKRVIDPSDPTRRFERRGFVFTVLDAQGAEVAHATTDSTGRAVFQHLDVGGSYTVREDASPVQNVAMLPPQTITLEHSHLELRLVNQVTVPNTGYGS